MNTAIQVQLKMRSAEIDAWVSEFTAALALLPQEVAQSFLGRLQDILRQPIVQVAKSADGSAVGASDGCITLKLLGMDELLSAARAAA